MVLTDIEIEAIKLAIEISKKCKPESNDPKPKVGAVLIKDNKIIAWAYRGEVNPGEHAEFTLLYRKNLKDEDIKGSTLVTTLEPCTARGHPNEPCALHIVKKGIKKVIIGSLDPNPDIRGKGVIFLRWNGIDIDYFPSEYSKQVEEINKDFLDAQMGKYGIDVMAPKKKIIEEISTSDNLLRLIKYLGDQLTPIDNRKLKDDLKMSEEELKAYLTEAKNKGLIKEKAVITCENCEEEIKEIKKVNKYVGKNMRCDNCDKEFTVTKDNILFYYSLTFKGQDFYNNKLPHIKPLIPRLNLLQYYVNKKMKEIKRPIFKDYFIVILLHFLRDLIPFLEALKSFGAEPNNCYLICKPYPYAYKEQIVTYLKSLGYNVKVADSFDEMSGIISSVLNKIKDRIEKSKRKGKSFIVVEDGGYIVPILHEKFKELLPYCKGAVEQTTKGIKRDEEIKGVKIPILDVARCDFKGKYEPYFIAEAVVRNIRNMLPDRNFMGQNALVIGYGTIGRKIVSSLRNTLGMKVYVSDKDPKALLEAATDPNVSRAYSLGRIGEIIGDCMLIIGTTGETSIGRREISFLSHGSILVSSSSDQVEIDVEELENLKITKEDIFSTQTTQKVGTLYTLRPDSKQITLLADGYPINFYYSESVPNESFDPVLTLLFLTTLELATRQEIPNKINTESVNDFVHREKLIENTLTFYRSIVV